MPLNDNDDQNPERREGIVALAAEMAAHGTGRDAPVRAVMGLLGDRWTTLILLLLATGELRHAELRRIMNRLVAEQKISKRVLTEKLRALEREGFVARSVSSDVPPRVGYRLTTLGEELDRETRRMIAWITGRELEIATARLAYDTASDD